jgi:asparagine synthase (glutamine-hydrolysing)
VKRWFVGWLPPSGHTDHLPVPAQSRSMWPAGGPRLWAVGDWAPWEIRVAEADGLRVAVFGACLASAGELAAAAAAIRRTGDHAVLARLPGSHASVLCDESGPGEPGVVIVTDLAGQHPVFHTSWAGGRLFASSPLPLADLLDAVPDPTWLVARLFCPDIPEATGTGSAFTGIARTRPGHILTITRSGPAEQPVPLRLGGVAFAEGAEALRYALLTAVERRVGFGCAVSSDLSGGLDSSSLACLAAKHLPGGLTAITYADPVSTNTDDLAYARLCTAAEPRLRQVLITGDQTCLPFTDLPGSPLLDEPAQDTLLITRTRARLAPAAAHQPGIHLTGDGGDAVLAGPLTYLADLVHPGRIRDLVREASAWARLRHRPAHTLVRAAARLARTDYATAIAQTARRLRDGETAPRRGVEDHLIWCTASPAAAWATDDTRRTLARRLTETATTVRDLAWCSTGDGAALRDIRAGGAGSRTFDQLAHEFGATVHVPFLDNQVITACAAVAIADRTTAHAAKPLLAAALAGLVPAELRRRRTKGDYTVALYAGLQQAAPTLRNMLTDPLLADLGLIQPEPARAALDAAVCGRSFPMAALGDVLAAEQWLRALHRPRPAFWEHTASAKAGN